MLRFLTVAALSVLTSGCMIGLVMSPIIPVKAGAPASQQANDPGNANAGTAPLPNNAANTPTVPSRTGTDDPAPATPAAPSIQQRFFGTWLAEDSSAGLDAVRFVQDPSVGNVPGGAVEASFQGGRVIGQFAISGNQIAMQFPGEQPFVHPFEFLSDGRLRIGQATYRKA